MIITIPGKFSCYCPKNSVNSPCFLTRARMPSFTSFLPFFSHYVAHTAVKRRCGKDEQFKLNGGSRSSFLFLYDRFRDRKKTKRRTGPRLGFAYTNSHTSVSLQCGLHNERKKGKKDMGKSMCTQARVFRGNYQHD